VTCRSIGRPGEAILTHIPAYPPFLSAPRLAQRRLHTAALENPGDRWQFNFNTWRDNLPADAAGYILCNPHNPTGRVLSRSELTQLAQICLERRMTICSDEIHCDLILSQECRHIPLASIDPEVADHTITLMAPSKTYNIPGLGCAFAVIANDALRRRFKQTMEGIVPHVNVMGLAATKAAYQHGGAWLKAMIEYLGANRDLVQDRVNNTSGLRMSPIEATYLAWIDVRPLGLPEPATFFEQAGIGLMDGADFGMSGYVRMNFGCRQKLLRKALDRLCDAVAAIRI
jgi:cysteine-S-conjugate beta-lyase